MTRIGLFAVPRSSRGSRAGVALAASIALGVLGGCYRVRTPQRIAVEGSWVVELVWLEQMDPSCIARPDQLPSPDGLQLALIPRLEGEPLPEGRYNAIWSVPSDASWGGVRATPDAVFDYDGTDLTYTYVAPMPLDGGAPRPAYQGPPGADANGSVPPSTWNSSSSSWSAYVYLRSARLTVQDRDDDARADVLEGTLEGETWVYRPDDFLGCNGVIRAHVRATRDTSCRPGHWTVPSDQPVDVFAAPGFVFAEPMQRPDSARIVVGDRVFEADLRPGDFATTVPFLGGMLLPWSTPIRVDPSAFADLAGNAMRAPEVLTTAAAPPLLTARSFAELPPDSPYAASIAWSSNENAPALMLSPGSPPATFRLPVTASATSIVIDAWRYQSGPLCLLAGSAPFTGTQVGGLFDPVDPSSFEYGPVRATLTAPIPPGAVDEIVVELGFCGSPDGYFGSPMEVVSLRAE